jgi:hypothetical protein
VRLPTAEEINPDGDPYDGALAVKHFLGKSLSDAEALFCDHQYNLQYFENLWFMGPKAFCYYVPAAIACLKSPSEFGHSVGYFGAIVSEHLKNEREELRTAIPALREAVQYILEHWDEWDEFDIGDAVYSDPKEMFTQLLKELSA